MTERKKSKNSTLFKYILQVFKEYDEIFSANNNKCIYDISYILLIFLIYDKQYMHMHKAVDIYERYYVKCHLIICSRVLYSIV